MTANSLVINEQDHSQLSDDKTDAELIFRQATKGQRFYFI
jgi:hypothetical protein